MKATRFMSALAAAWGLVQGKFKPLEPNPLLVEHLDLFE